MSAMRLFIQRHWTTVAVVYATLVCVTAGFLVWSIPAKPSQPVSSLMTKQSLSSVAANAAVSQ
jgi:hypothetical protein